MTIKKIKILLLIVPFMLLMSCNNKEKNAGIIGTWYSSEYESDYESIYNTFDFYDDGLGCYCLWSKTPNSSTGTASSDYSIHFSYTLIDNILTLDYGLGYIIKYHVESIGDDLLTMTKGLHGGSLLFYNRHDSYTRGVFTDYETEIIGKWDINDTEKSRRYIVSFRADKTYESTSSTNNGSTVTETGTYVVENSRVKLTSSTAGSLLNNRIFMISHCFRSQYSSGVQGSIHLISENEVMIYGSAID